MHLLQVDAYAFIKKRLTHTQRPVNLVNTREEWLLDVHPTAVVLLQSLLFMLKPLKQASAGLPAPSSRGRLCCRAGLTAPPYSHRWPSHPSTHPHMLLFSGDGRRTSKPSYCSAWETTAEYSLAPCRSLPRPCRRPPPWCSRRGLVNVVNDRHASEVDYTWRG